MLTSALAVGTLLLLYAVLYLYRRRGDAVQDMVTGLPSRDVFDLYLRQCVARASRHPDYGFAVLLLEIRGFDETRRRLGRFGAEEILADFAERVIACVRPTDVVARFADDDFAVVLDEVSEVTDATRVAVRVHESLTEAMTIAGQSAPVRLRVGVSVSLPGAIRDTGAMLVEAESALERARTLERPYVVFDQELDARSVENLSLESRLLKSLDRDELRMGYSPLIASDTGQLVGFSALLQWQQPDGGLVTARNFIHIAESSREILRIGAWAVTEACNTLAVLSEIAGRPMLTTVNVGELELSRGDVAGVVERALVNHQHLAPYLRIEIPASVLLTLGPTVEATVNRLRAFGVGVHLDQVAGSGIPLRRALQLDVEGVRINLVSFGETRSDLRRRLPQLLAACRTFAREIVVEGIETGDEAALVAALDPPVIAHGFYFGPLRSFDDAAELASARAPRLRVVSVTPPSLPAKNQSDAG